MKQTVKRLLCGILCAAAVFTSTSVYAVQTDTNLLDINNIKSIPMAIASKNTPTLLFIFKSAYLFIKVYAYTL